MKENRQEGNLKDELKNGRKEQMEIKEEMREAKTGNMKQKN
jgi:hypothetical protein